MNYYELLQVSQTASREVIEMAYKALAKKYHPDLNDPNIREQCLEVMKHLNEAKSILLDENLRVQYDEYLETLSQQHTYEDNIENYEDQDTTLEQYKPRPWVRFFARYIDMYIGTVIIATVWAMISPNTYLSTLQNTNRYILNSLVFAVWLIIEAFIVSSTGTTLGKWLFNTKVLYYDNNKLTFKNAFIRNFNVFTKGMWCIIPFATYYPMGISYSNLKKGELMPWDIISNSRIIHQKLNKFKVILGAAGFVFLLYYNYS